MGGGFICGNDTPTLADVAAYCEIGQCSKQYCDLIDFKPYPNIRRWMNACKKIPGYESSHEMLKQMAPRIRRRVEKKKGSRLTAPATPSKL